MTIFSFEEGLVPQGNFIPEATIIGVSRTECLAALQRQYHYFDDVGVFTRSDSYLDEYGEPYIKETQFYTVIGGSIR